ncbi:MAG: hypothetical protein J6T31_07420, partial [Methanobrevibacter sp.]|nr:hypothetical protein [Methanobrevibacter sp.]
MHITHHFIYTQLSTVSLYQSWQLAELAELALDAQHTQPLVKLLGHHVLALNAVAAHPAAVPNTVPLGFNLPAVSVTTMLLLVVPKAVPIVGIQLAAVPVFTVAA